MPNERRANNQVHLVVTIQVDLVSAVAELFAFLHPGAQALRPA